MLVSVGMKRSPPVPVGRELVNLIRTGRSFWATITRSQIMGGQQICVGGVGLAITPELGSAGRGGKLITDNRRKVRVHPLTILDHLDFVVIGPWIRCGVRYGDGNALSQIVCEGPGSTAQGWQCIHEFSEAVGC